MYRWCVTWWSYCYCFNLKYICTRWFFKCLSIPEISYVWNTPSEPLLIPPPDFVCTAISFAVSFCRDKSSILLIRYVGNTPSEPLLVPPLDFAFTCNPLLMLSDSSVYIQNTYTYKKREGKGEKSILNHVRRPRPWNPKAVSPGPRAPPWPRPAAPAPRLHSAAPERQHVRARTTAWQLRGGGVPAAAAFASAPACRRRSAFSRSPSCTCAMSGVSPENGSLRSSAAAPVPVTRRRSKQSCVWTRLHKLTSALLLSIVTHARCSMHLLSLLPLRHALTRRMLIIKSRSALHHHRWRDERKDHLMLFTISTEGIFCQLLFAILMLAGGHRNSKPAVVISGAFIKNLLHNHSINKKKSFSGDVNYEANCRQITTS